MVRKRFCLGTLSLLIIMAFVSLACGSNLEKDVIGTWKAVKVDGPESAKSQLVRAEIEFFSDKTYNSTFDDPGQWIILDDGRIKIQNPVEVKFATIRGKQMIIDLSKMWGKGDLFLEKKAAR